MYRLERSEFVQSRYVSLWSLLGFQAGFLNAFGFLACGRYVSHVTGFGTQIGIALAENRPLFALELLGFPAAFILGSFVNGLATAARLERKQRPSFDGIMWTIPGLLLLLIGLGELGLFGPFGEILVLPRDFALLFLLSFLCGMQNGAIAVLTKGQIRTTHLTGISTDIGTDFARLWKGNLEREERMLTTKTNFSRIFTFLGFTAGSIASVVFSQRLDYQALWVPFGTSLASALIFSWIGRNLSLRARREARARA